MTPDPRLVQFPGSQVSYPPAGSSERVDFAPDYTPQEMIRAGVFGDAYFGDELGQARLKLLPSDWTFTKSGRFYTNIRGSQCRLINQYGRPASEPREFWLEKRLIAHFDPLGWFEWYCHYWLGRRVDLYDDWQIGRWRRFKERHLALFYQTGYPGSAQALLHWGIRVDFGRIF